MKIEEQHLKAWMPAIQDIARGAGRILMDFYQGGATVEIKPDGSPVTEADHASQNYILPALRQLTPDIALISEENKVQPDVSDGRPFWTVDPLDGTKGFLRKNGQFFVKIALLDQFRPVLGVIYQPATDRLFYSITGEKAWQQRGKRAPLEMTTRRAPQKAMLKTVFNSLFYDPAAYEAARSKLVNDGLRIPKLEKAKGLCQTAFNMEVAAGRADAFICCGRSPGLKSGNGRSWDYAPDWLILKNAGGVIVEIAEGKEVDFNEPTTRMHAMISLGDRELGKRCFPKLKNDCF